MRTGIYDKSWNAHKLAPAIKEWGASLLTVNQRGKKLMNIVVWFLDSWKITRAEVHTFGRLGLYQSMC